MDHIDFTGRFSYQHTDVFTPKTQLAEKEELQEQVWSGLCRLRGERQKVLRIPASVLLSTPRVATSNDGFQRLPYTSVHRHDFTRPCLHRPYRLPKAFQAL